MLAHKTTYGWTKLRKTYSERIEHTRQLHRDWAQRRWLAGVCRQCGKDDESGFVNCADCRKRNRDYHAAHYAPSKHQPWLLICQGCNKMMATRRKHKLYCSNRCKTRAAYYRKKGT